ncbi:hypothetical protein M407DRAFT_233820 [Tulasnella calospora MUT 4182]|uniref:Uncharacterized protein n=1 Tax=Tulasnella calospora MUT 4182 TaxID=1051891 RepID=A0A0C3L063_9AGAM|nr:hypothetical protein M407DRAFT_233820 [Tulasnella calospora MUT 4182]
MSVDRVARTIKGLVDAAQAVRRARTATEKHEALVLFDHRLDIDQVYPTYGRDHIAAWTGVCSSRLWEVFIDLLAVPWESKTMPPTDMTEVTVQYMCAYFTANLVHGCTRYLRSSSAIIDLKNRLPQILQHHAWLVENIGALNGVYGLKSGIIKVLCIALSSEANSDIRSHLLNQLNRDLVLQLIFSLVLDPHTYESKWVDSSTLLNVVDGLLGFGFSNNLSTWIASWAVIKFGPSSVADGFFKYSQAVGDNGEVGDFVAPPILASHLLAARELHSTLINDHHVHLFCINTYWRKIKEDAQVDGTPVRTLAVIEDSQRRALMVQELVEKADLNFLVATACLHTRHDEDNAWNPFNAVKRDWRGGFKEV